MARVSYLLIQTFKEKQNEQEKLRGTFQMLDGNIFLTSSSCHPKALVKEFSYFLMPCHQHGLGVNLLVQR